MGKVGRAEPADLRVAASPTVSPKTLLKNCVGKFSLFAEGGLESLEGDRLNKVQVESRL